MRTKVYTRDFHTPCWAKHSAILLGSLTVILFGVGAAVYAGGASVPNTFADGDTLSAAKMNANFQALADAIAAQQASIEALQTTVTSQQGTITALQGAKVPAGTIMAFAGATPPDGWLLCDGSAVSRTTYAALFAATLIKYGGGDGINTFNLPDARGRVILGAGAGAGLTSRVVGQVLGEETHTLNIGEMPAHSHTGQTGGVNVGGTWDGRLLEYNGAGSDRGFQYSGYTLAGSNPFNNHQHAVSTVVVGGGAAHNTMPPSLVLSCIIKY
jgi:microcystin-dependent protein